MNKKGFTLIELLSTITIMTLIATIASFNFIKLFHTKEKENLESVNQVIMQAACVYVELEKNQSLKENCLTNGCDITTDTLIQEGLLQEQDVDHFQVIHINNENNQKQCVLK